MISFNSAHAVNEKDFIEIESLIDNVLPPELKDFFTKASGSRPYPNIFYFVQNGKKDGSAFDSVPFITPATKKDKTSTLSWNIKNIQQSQNRYPKRSILIGDDPYGNAILYYFAGPNQGQVWFWDHEMEEDFENVDPQTVPEIYPNMALIANSLHDFLDNLEEPEEV